MNKRLILPITPVLWQTIWKGLQPEVKESYKLETFQQRQYEKEVKHYTPPTWKHHVKVFEVTMSMQEPPWLVPSLVDEEDQVLHPEVKLGEDLPGGQVEVAGAEVFRWDEA